MQKEYNSLWTTNFKQVVSRDSKFFSGTLPDHRPSTTPGQSSTITVMSKDNHTVKAYGGYGGTLTKYIGQVENPRLPEVLLTNEIHTRSRLHPSQRAPRSNRVFHVLNTRRLL
jgi:hypothetical protein